MHKLSKLCLLKTLIICIKFEKVICVVYITLIDLNLNDEVILVSDSRLVGT